MSKQTEAEKAVADEALSKLNETVERLRPEIEALLSKPTSNPMSAMFPPSPAPVEPFIPDIQRNGGVTAKPSLRVLDVAELDIVAENVVIETKPTGE